MHVLNMKYFLLVCEFVVAGNQKCYFLAPFVIKDGNNDTFANIHDVFMKYIDIVLVGMQSFARI